MTTRCPQFLIGVIFALATLGSLCAATLPTGFTESQFGGNLNGT